MSLFGSIFVIALTLAVAVQVWLAKRQIAHVLAHRDRVPAAFQDAVPLPVHQRAADYTLAKTRLSLVDLGVSALLLLAWTLGGGLNALDQAWDSLGRAWGLSPLPTGVGFMLSVFVLITLLELPLSAYRTFVLEKRFGFNRTTPRLFITDSLKQLVLMVLLGAPLIAMVLALMGYAGSLWWLFAWLVWMAFTLLLV
jgi:STE24 endopeptidase